MAARNLQLIEIAKRAVSGIGMSGVPWLLLLRNDGRKKLSFGFGGRVVEGTKVTSHLVWLHRIMVFPIFSHASLPL
jgi:hypothetical protein